MKEVLEGISSIIFAIAALITAIKLPWPGRKRKKKD